MFLAISQSCKSHDNPSHSGGIVRAIPFEGDDEALARALKAGHPGAPTALYERYASHVRCVIARVMGVDQDLQDLLHDTFIQAFKSVHKLKDNTLLKNWLSSVAIYTVRYHIRKRQIRRIVHLIPPEETARFEVRGPSDERRQAVRATYEVFDHMPVDLRIPFALRFIEGMEHKEIADACRISVATVKRRIAKGEKRFVQLALKHPVLKERVEQGSRWGNDEGA